ncbi:Crp/Fnr family transcriptional regulator [Texcoconibacillus texcoconensis]|uniref:CRP/FNR family cyclic AMP-dependent transcriptional regulator n=1 Tax=Texcoconibacillus texcoconensis TaxID=1095777 RepID=A0A840QM58_9BACI|nr:Crp/Fnr family transcriptional regulator [Texcoconibacillus texcoconensis]MBB5172462.1 CRP/FNR family cyclic AMP-dependent transcriptional regulator [Texcoconibacillus texcoconensis]
MEDIIEAISKAPQPQRQYLQTLFEDYPSTSHSFRTEEMKTDTKFISANDACNELWILIDGQVRAIEEQISGDVYVFSEFQAPALFGEMEGLAGNTTYKATLVTSTACQFIVLPMENYINWIRNDPEALFFRTREIMSSILEQTTNERTYLFLNAADRLMLYMTNYYRKHAKDKTCTIQIKRQEIADQTGYSLKTVNRSIKKLSDNGLITNDRGKIVISERQYERLVALIEEKFSQ